MIRYSIVVSIAIALWASCDSLFAQTQAADEILVSLIQLVQKVEARVIHLENEKMAETAAARSGRASIDSDRRLKQINAEIAELRAKDKELSSQFDVKSTPLISNLVLTIEYLKIEAEK